jgi:hypothetical protein
MCERGNPKAQATDHRKAPITKQQIQNASVIGVLNLEFIRDLDIVI